MPTPWTIFGDSVSFSPTFRRRVTKNDILRIFISITPALPLRLAKQGWAAQGILMCKITVFTNLHRNVYDIALIFTRKECIISIKAYKFVFLFVN